MAPGFKDSWIPADDLVCGISRQGGKGAIHPDNLAVVIRNHDAVGSSLQGGGPQVQQRFSALALLRNGSLMQGALDCERQTRQPVFKDKVGNTLLDALNSGFLSQGSRHQDEWNIFTLPLQRFQRVES